MDALFDLLKFKLFCAKDFTFPYMHSPPMYFNFNIPCQGHSIYHSSFIVWLLQADLLFVHVLIMQSHGECTFMPFVIYICHCGIIYLGLVICFSATVFSSTLVIVALHCYSQGCFLLRFALEHYNFFPEQKCS